MTSKTKKVFVIKEGNVIDAQRCLGELALEYARLHKDEFEEFLKNKKIQSKEKKK